MTAEFRANVSEVVRNNVSLIITLPAGFHPVGSQAGKNQAVFFLFSIGGFALKCGDKHTQSYVCFCHICIIKIHDLTCT